MQPESFESNIRRVIANFERQPPQGSWDRIQQNISPKARMSFSKATLGLGALAATLTLFIGLEILQCFAPTNVEEAEIARGRELFMQNCATCHNINMKDHMTGPALGGVTERWSDYPAEDLHNYIRSSQKMIADGHPKAVALHDQWPRSVMPNYPNLTDQDIAQLLSFVEWQFQQN